MTVRVKICCIESEEAADHAIAAGASALGLVSAMPSGPGVIDDALIARIAARAPPGVATFLLTCRTDPREIVAQARACGTTTVQIVDRVDRSVYATLRRELPDMKIVQAIHVENARAVDEARDLASRVDALLLDSGRPTAAIKELGGTGRVHDWALSRWIVEAVPCPVYLAGGLTADNVADAIRAVRPFGIDLCSGVRTGARLDPAKLGALMRAARDAA